jgi:hypothetical protein
LCKHNPQKGQIKEIVDFATICSKLSPRFQVSVPGSIRNRYLLLHDGLSGLFMIVAGLQQQEAKADGCQKNRFYKGLGIFHRRIIRIHE